jgi:hypothetical protein
MTMEAVMTRSTSILKTGLMDEYATSGTESDMRTTSLRKSTRTETNELSYMLESWEEIGKQK